MYQISKEVNKLMTLQKNKELPVFLVDLRPGDLNDGRGPFFLFFEMELDLPLDRLREL